MVLNLTKPKQTDYLGKYGEVCQHVYIENMDKGKLPIKGNNNMGMFHMVIVIMVYMMKGNSVNIFKNNMVYRAI